MQDFQFSLVFPIMKAKAAAVTTAEFNPSLISFDHKRYIHLFPATSTSLCLLYSVLPLYWLKATKFLPLFLLIPFTVIHVGFVWRISSQNTFFLNLISIHFLLQKKLIWRFLHLKLGRVNFLSIQFLILLFQSSFEILILL